MKISAEELQRSLIDWSIQNSGYDEYRNYIGLSTIADCSAVIYHRFFNAVPSSVRQKLKTKLSYEIEENIKARLRAMGIYSPGKEISIADGLVRGHTDGEILGNLLEIKTIPKDEYIPNGKIPARAFWQTQAYLHYGKYDLGFVLYFSRESGPFRVFEVWPNDRIIEAIEEKIDHLLIAVTRKISPICECRKCGGMEVQNAAT